MARLSKAKQEALLAKIIEATPGAISKVTLEEMQWLKGYVPVQPPVPPVAPQSAPELLHKAASIMESRAATYDQPEGERSMGKTVAAFNIVTGMQLKESDGWYFMEMLKNVRQYQNPTYHQDSAEDGVAYSALKGEALEREG